MGNHTIPEQGVGGTLRAIFISGGGGRMWWFLTEVVVCEGENNGMFCRKRKIAGHNLSYPYLDTAVPNMYGGTSTMLLSI